MASYHTDDDGQQMQTLDRGAGAAGAAHHTEDLAGGAAAWSQASSQLGQDGQQQTADTWVPCLWRLSCPAWRSVRQNLPFNGQPSYSPIRLSRKRVAHHMTASTLIRPEAGKLPRSGGRAHARPAANSPGGLMLPPQLRGRRACLRTSLEACPRACGGFHGNLRGAAQLQWRLRPGLSAAAGYCLLTICQRGRWRPCSTVAVKRRCSASLIGCQCSPHKL
jgi:hypothetical protein